MAKEIRIVHGYHSSVWLFGGRGDVLHMHKGIKARPVLQWLFKRPYNPAHKSDD